ncbi:MAG: amidohydrolase family protein [Pseudomonadota bacterium]
MDEKIVGRCLRRNQWSVEQSAKHPEFISLINIDPRMDADIMRDEVRNRVAEGARGVNVHSCMQRFYLFDRRMWPCYEVCDELQVPVCFHTGDFGGTEFDFSPQFHSNPKFLLDVLRDFPTMPVIMSHMGRPFSEHTKDIAERYPHINFDCTGLLSKKGDVVSEEYFIEMIQEIGVERIVIGTDYPHMDSAAQFGRLRGLNLTEQEKKLILRDNALRIFKIAA